MNLSGCITGIGQWIRSKWKIFLAVFVIFGCVFSASMISSQPIRADDSTDYVDPDGDGEIDKDPDGGWEGKPLENILTSIYSAKITMFGIPIDFANLPDSIDNFIDIESLKDLSTSGGGSSADEKAKASSLNLYDFFKDTVFPVAQGLGTTLLTLMMMWKYIKECMEVERFTWERALMIFAKMFIVNMFIGGAFWILEMFANTANDLMSFITMSTPEVTSVGEALAQAVTDTSSWLEKMAVFVVGIMLAFAYYGTAIAVIIQVLVRVVKILVAMSFSPIPIALSMDEQHGTDVFRYCFWTFGLFLQAPIIKISTWIYSQVLTEVAGSGGDGLASVIPIAIGICVCNGLLAGLISMGQQVTDRVVPA